MMVARAFNCDESRLRSFLDEGLPEMEQAQLTDHLDHCASCRRTLERLAAGSRLWAELPQLVPPAGESATVGITSQTARTSEPDHALDFLGLSDAPGTLGRLGPYEVTEVLGRGGFGVVLKAFDPRLGRTVAIKVLASQLATSAAARSRFAREAKAAAAVVHDHVVAIHAVDSWNGLPYLVMPYVAGCSLQERIDRDGPLGVKEVLRIGMQTALGLTAAHAQGLVHRDVKPSNILLENGVERVKLTDFGLARAVDDASLTQSGVVAGTPQYMSPEQALGEAVDHRSDLFSLGSVLYFTCAGHPPFRANSTPAILRRVCDDRPRPLRDVNPEVPVWLADFIERLHAKDPAGRFQSAAEVAEVMGGYLSLLQRGLPIESPQSKALPSLPKRSGRKRMAAGVAFVSVAVLAVGCAMSLSGIPSLLALLSLLKSEESGSPSAGIGQDGAIQLVVTEPSEPQIIGSGKPATKRWALAEFTAVQITHPFRVELTRGDHFEVTTTADDNVLDHVLVAKVGNQLQIRLEDKRRYRLRRDSLKVAITLPVLESLDLSHGIRATIAGFASKQPFEASVNHGSRLAGSMSAGRLVIGANHGSEVTLKGTAETAQITVNHGSNLPLEAFVIGDAVVRVAHGSKATINARSAKDLTAEVEHSGALEGTVQAGILNLKAEHSSQVHLSGSAQKAAIKGAFSSRFALGALALDAAEVHLDHSSSAVVNAKSNLDYNLGNSSNLRYAGNPAIGRSVASRESSARALRGDEQKAMSNPAPAARTNASGPAGSSSDRSREDGNEIITIDLSNNSNNWFGAGTTIFTGSPGESLIEGSGRQITKAVDAKDFSAIQIDRLLIADVTRADAFAVSLTADDNILERIEVVRDGSTLRISLANGNYRLRNRPRATITLPHLEAFRLSGASKATLKGFKTDKAFQLKVSGASELEGAIDVGSGEFQIDGASSAVMTGSARAGHLLADGASRLKLTGFVLSQCQLELNGASNASLQVKSNQPFKAKLDGASTLSGLVDATDLELTADGSSTAALRGSAKNAKLIADGASQLKLSELSLDANQMIVAASGTSSVKLAGKCRAAALAADGASHLDLGGLAVDAADVKLSGVSHATLDVRASLKYDLSSGSNLTYSGTPAKVDGKKSDGATLSHH